MSNGAGATSRVGGGSVRRPWAARLVAGLALTALALSPLAVAGCTAEPVAPADSAVESPFHACPATPGPTGSTPRAGSAMMTGSAPTAALPAVILPCFTGGQPVLLAGLGQPAVINFWASSCAPCRKELPQLQRFADATTGRIAVVGVVTRDTRVAAASLGDELGIRFPAVFDADAALRSAWGRNVLPVTLFVDAEGQVRHEDVSGALTFDELSQLAARYLGVAA